MTDHFEVTGHMADGQEVPIQVGYPAEADSSKIVFMLSGPDHLALAMALLGPDEAEQLGLSILLAAARLRASVGETGG